MDTLRVVAIAHNVFRETIRDRILYLVMVFAVVMLGAIVLIPEVANQAHNKVIADLGLAAIHFLGLIVAIFVGTGLVNKEIEKRTVYVLIAKPMSRAEFIVGKHLGLAALLSVLLAIMTAIFLLGLLLVQAEIPLFALLWAAVFIFLELVLIVAAALLFGVFTSSILATLYTIALFLMGHASRALLQLSRLVEDAGFGKVFEVIYLVLPDLERLNLRDAAVYGQIPSAGELLGDALYGLVYTTLLLILAVLVFARRQF
ncbi:ABC transporter permease [Synechococcus sp. Nb3U1]|uniref:ABC transporter permease n=1 Tax=Synechococcus sp. Nb3U1 TaxID=1914529 RepID=UPI001F27EAB4|nr:ABC transporter permease [Synechococcus sp. Nb3U1]MCF2971421.1 ABC transporter permease [Synechococcus sp. Nb3U1]